MRLTFLKSSDKKHIESQLKERFGIKEIPGMLLRRGQERIFIYQGSLTQNQIENLEEWTQVERVGIYFAKIINDEIRLSIEGVQILKNQITKNIFELNEKQAQEWMQGQELPIATGKRGFLIMKYKEDLLGTGKASEFKIGNYIPKSRRLKSKSIVK